MSKLKNLPHRSWSVLKDLWVPHVSDVRFEDGVPSPTIWYLPGLTELGTTARDLEEMALIPGVRESVYRECIIWVRKVVYCRAAAYLAAGQGFPTWATILSYEACYYAARSFICLSGFTNIGRHSKLYLDIFGAREEKIDRKSKKTVYDMHIAHFLSDHLTHKMTWSLVERIVDTYKFAQPHADAVIEFKALDFGQLSNVRNNIMYDAAFWIMSSDSDHCDLVKRFGSLEILEAMTKDSDIDFEGSQYFSTSRRMVGILSWMLQDISKSAPVVASEWRVLGERLSTVYV